MSYTYDFYLDGVKLPTPSNFDIEYSPLSSSSSGRLLDGTMVNKGIAKKYKVVLYYDNDMGITDDDIITIIGGTWDKFGTMSEETYQFSFILPGGKQQVITAYFGPFKLSRGKANEPGEWKGFKLEIIEK